jgi:octaprenyl-diphosphate synthase
MTSHEITQTTDRIADNDVQIPELGIIDTAMRGVERLMSDVVASDVPILRDASRHILQAGGKRLRPRLLLLSHVATGGENLRRAIPPAAAVELVHTASVVHDDINDHGVIRRGRPSINSIWGRTFALLTGDFLFTKVYELMAPYQDLNILLAEATVALVEGETLQASAVKEANLTREVYFDIIARKTAALFRAGTMIGAALNNADDIQTEALGQYGFNIGLAFQIVDDILDLTGSEEQLGKTAGLDRQQGKGLASVHENGDPFENVKRKLLEGDRIDRAREQAAEFVEAGIATLDVLPDSLYRDELEKLAYSVLERSS